MREMDTGLIGLLVGVAGAVLGWWWRGARAAERLDNALAEIGKLDARIKSLESGSLQTASSLGTISAEIQSIGRTLTRLDQKLDMKADK